MKEDELPFLTYIAAEHGENTRKNLKEWMNFKMKWIKATRRRVFLLTCRTEDLKPDFINNIGTNISHLRIHNKKVKNKFDRKLRSFETQMLNLQIEDCNSHISYLNRNIDKLENSLVNIIPQTLYKDIVNSYQIKLIYTNNSIYDRHKLKLEKLRKQQTKLSHYEYNEKWLVNLTDHDIPPHVKRIVALGPKFNMEKEKLNLDDKINIVKDIEKTLVRVPDETKNVIRKIVVEECILDKNKKQKHINYEQKLINKHLKETKQYAKQHDMIFTNADKGNVTVALNKSDYNNKIKEMLSNTTTYEVIRKNMNPLNNITKKLHEICKRWFDKGYIDNNMYKFINRTDSNLPKFYALPKIHKKNTPFRPIISFIDSPLYNLSKFLADIISKNIPTSDYGIKNSFEFKEKIDNVNIKSNYTMVSFDVTSLFTNISHTSIIDAVKRRWASIQTNCKIPWDDRL